MGNPVDTADLCVVRGNFRPGEIPVYGDGLTIIGWVSVQDPKSWEAVFYGGRHRYSRQFTAACEACAVSDVSGRRQTTDERKPQAPQSVIQEPTWLDMIDLLIADAKGREAEEQRSSGLWINLDYPRANHL